MKSFRLYIALAVLLSIASPTPAAGDVKRGAKVFAACAGCHSLAPEDHRTGPSLASVYGRRAATSAGFPRYSTALRDAGVLWDAEALDTWLRDPAAFIPGNVMFFKGIPEASARDDLVAYLRAVSEGTAAGVPAKSRSLPDLKQADPGQRITAIRHCQDSYFVTFGNGETYPFWEFNLRFKTDASPHGPAKGEPVAVGAGMGGDRAQIVFAEPAEISAFIRSHCE